MMLRNFIIGVFIVGLFLEVSGLIWSSKTEKPSEIFLKLSEPPARMIDNPLENGYFLLLGFASSTGSHPVQVGYDIWLESDAKPSERGYDLDKPGRSDLRVAGDVDRLLPEWNSPDPVSEIQRRETPVLTPANSHGTLLSRYKLWLTMRSEDWGYAHRGGPRIEEILWAHRLYITEGFHERIETGLDRLATDLSRWRHALRDARSLPMKVLAQVILEDDVLFISRLLNHTDVDRAILTRGSNLLQPLTPGEYSLRWPVQSQFMLGYAREMRSGHNLLQPNDQDEPTIQSLARAAHLDPGVFRTVEHPPLRDFLGFSSSSQRVWDTYAAFYDATIKTADSVHSPLPKMRDIVRDSRLTLLERIVNPLEFSPNWEPFSQRLVETDARLRLAALQIVMRKQTETATIPTRLAEAGSAYFDPFTGLPMLWSPTQNKLYSVGKDRLDDGGDPSFDISVPLAVALDSTPAAKLRSTRR